VISRGKLAAQVLQLVVIFALPLFGAAGTLDWAGGWVFLVLFFGFVAALTAWLYRNNPALLKERMTATRPDQKTWDKVLMGGMLVLFIGWLALMALDAVRFRWSMMPGWVQAIGAVVLVGSFYALFATFRENSYLSPVVRVQADRGQTVVASGPYAIVRHPMYAAFLLLVVGTALLLGSLWGLAGGTLLVVLVARRAVLEERTLRDELEGYGHYMAKVRYRLVPLLW